MLQIILLHKKNRHLIQHFLEEAGTALHHFRYFNSRTTEVLDHHRATYLIQVHDKYVGYGHLDEEAGVVWLGIAIADQYQGLGLGKLMMDTLLAAAKIQKLKAIQLAVDSDNEKAIRLYHKMGFDTLKEGTNITFMKLLL